MRYSTIIVSLLILFVPVAYAQQQSSSIVTGKAVYFFAPSKEEVEKSDEDMESLNDFDYYTQQILPYLKTNHINYATISDKLIQVRYGSDKKVIVNRNSISFGTILSDGKQKPKILEYVQTDVDLMNAIKQFFKVK